MYRPFRYRPFRRLLAAATGSLLAAASAVTVLSTASAEPAGPAHAAETLQAEFEQVTLAKGASEMGEPMSLAVLPDRWVLHSSRDGTLRATDPDGTTSVAARLDVYTHDEQGLQGIAADPDFATNRFVYLYYAPPLDTPSGDAPNEGTAADFEPWKGVNRLSRFTLNEDHTLDLGSEVTVLDVATDRGQCCHAGGDIAFDAEGNLYLTTGDNSNPFASDGYTPIDERGNRNPAYDAQRSAGNTNDLRGKLLRISVNADGSYDIPEGNLFAPGTSQTRPEIYAMGFRNPFRMSVDKETGVVYVGDYGPDAGTASPTRGPGGMVEFARVTEPGNFGWPYCVGDNQPYIDHDFANGASGSAFDCSAPTNNSPRNTGQTSLPPAQPAWIPYDGGSVPEFGTGSESPMAGPVYDYDPDLDSAVKFPQEYDGDFFAMEFGRRWIKNIDVNPDGSRGTIHDFPWSGTQLMDAEFGPDGALYVVDYGTGWGGGDNNSALYRIEHVTGGQAVAAETSADPAPGQAPPAVDADPTVTIELPADGQIVDFGDAVPYEVTVTDPEAGEIDCSKVTMDFILGHDSHGHHLTSETGCSGTLQTPADIGHDGNANIFGVWDAAYTDADGLTTHGEQHVTQPGQRQAEHFSDQSGVERTGRTNARGGLTAGNIDDGDWISLEPYVLADATAFTARVSSAGPGGSIEIRAGSPTGTLLGSVDVPNTGGWETFQDVTTALSGAPAGTTTLHLVFTGPTGDDLLDVDDFTFTTGE